MKILIIISVAFMTSCGWIEKAAITKAIILCADNNGLDRIRLPVVGPVMIYCKNGARFDVDNAKIYTKIEGL